MRDEEKIVLLVVSYYIPKNDHRCRYDGEILFKSRELQSSEEADKCVCFVLKPWTSIRPIVARRQARVYEDIGGFHSSEHVHKQPSGVCSDLITTSITMCASIQRMILREKEQRDQRIPPSFHGTQ